jgi:hypothetical protein
MFSVAATSALFRWKALGKCSVVEAECVNLVPGAYAILVSTTAFHTLRQAALSTTSLRAARV